MPRLKSLILYAALVVLVMVAQTDAVRLPGTGALASSHDLLVELHANELEPGAWPMGREVPYRYRWLFRAIVLEVERLSPALQTERGFYQLFVAASALSLFLACVVFDRLIVRLGFDERKAALGVALFLLGFPVVFAYDMPIHTREDFLEYAVFCGALIAVIADHPIATVFLVTLAANVREMGLLAAAPYWFTSRRPRWVRAVVIGLSTLGTLSVTSIREGRLRIPWFLDRSVWRPEGYRTTVSAPGEGALYVFLCFGALWVTAYMGARVRRRRLGDRAYEKDLLGFPVAFLAIAAALVSSILLGQVREVRTVYLAFPWAIGLTLEWLASDEPREIVRSRAARVTAGIVLALGMVLLAQVAQDPAFVARLRESIGRSFQPGFVAPRLVNLEGGEQALVYDYTASPWNGVWLVAHASLAAGLVAGAIATRRERRRAVPNPPTEETRAS